MNDMFKLSDMDGGMANSMMDNDVVDGDADEFLDIDGDPNEVEDGLTDRRVDRRETPDDLYDLL